MLARTMEGEDVTPDVPYTLSAMSDDAVGLIEHLGYESAHVVGVSMGGMIVQVMAIEHPERLRSVTSIMSTTGDRSVGKPTREALTALLAPPADGREAVIAQTVERNRILAGPLWDREESEIGCAATYDRSFYPAGAAFQQAAIYATGDRTEGLRSVEVPFLVVHGREDSIISWTGGIATAEAVAGADLLVLAEMGHELSSKVIPQVADAIHAIAHR
ncbi:MAG: alpha/beta hydrolase [Acidimicrobiales bacterium]